jgi:hypothetical protein
MESEPLFYLAQNIGGPLFAGCVVLAGTAALWALRSAYHSYTEEITALARYERISSLNLTNLKDNFDIVDKWIHAIDQGRVFRQPFSQLVIDDEDVYKLKKLPLIRRAISLNYKLQRTSIDLQNIATGYWETIVKIDSNPDPAQKSTDFNAFNANIRETLVSIGTNREPLNNDLIDFVAAIRVHYDVRRVSLFRLLGFLFIDLFPRISEKKIKIAEAALRSEIAAKAKISDPAAS